MAGYVAANRWQERACSPLYEGVKKCGSGRIFYEFAFIFDIELLPLVTIHGFGDCKHASFVILNPLFNYHIPFSIHKHNASDWFSCQIGQLRLTLLYPACKATISSHLSPGIHLWLNSTWPSCKILLQRTWPTAPAPSFRKKGARVTITVRSAYQAALR